MRALAIVAAAIALVPQVAQAIVVHVEAGTLTASVSSALIAERPALRLATTPDAADLVVAVRRLEGAIEVVADTRAGARVIERQIVQPDALAPVLRLIVLLVVEAVDALGEPRAPTDAAVDRPASESTEPIESSEPSESSEPRPASSDTSAPGRAPADAGSAAASVLRLGLTAGASWWATPATAQVGPGLRVGWAMEPVSLDLLLAVAPCCRFEEVGVVDGTPLSLSAMVDGSFAFYSADPIQLLASVGVGIGYREVSGFARAFVGLPGEETQSAVEVLLRAGAGAAWRMAEHWSLEARAGAELRPNRLRISLPPPYPQGANAVDPGVIAPFFELAVVVQIF